eukprot:TRINITY_DN54723_c0_g1_i1.p1 TRINITY_DN54723_c0_g1~~TRINITY_DN54723_c0_g1_i1.p1  ORF type:complete len:354 (+),score=33.04 TRINITY_DN54723_c0_g1_i1:67-1062(+)
MMDWGQAGSGGEQVHPFQSAAYQTVPPAGSEHVAPAGGNYQVVDGSIYPTGGMHGGVGYGHYGQLGGGQQQLGGSMYAQPPGVGMGMPPPLARKVRQSLIMTLCLFAAACFVMFGALIAFLALLFTFSFLDLVNLFYIFVFGALLAILDLPFCGGNTRVIGIQEWLGKYANILMRVTGKGLIFIFLGCTLFSTMYSNLGSTGMRVLAVLLNLFVILVGIVVTISGIITSRKLRAAQMALANGVLESRYHEYNRTYPEIPPSNLKGGMTPSEFVALTRERCGMEWSETELRLAFNALVGSPSWRVSRMHPAGDVLLSFEDLQKWVVGFMVLV